MIFRFLFYIIMLFVAFCVAGVLFFVWMARKTKRQIDELGNRMGREQQRRQDGNIHMNGQQSSKQKQKEQKIFGDDEGEYVDFEEEK